MATATEVQNNLGRYLKLAQEEVAHLISKDRSVSFLSDSLVGVLSGDVDETALNAERIMRHEGPR